MQTKEKEFISLSHDLLFKEIMTHPQNRKALIDFLSCFTDFKKEELLNSKLEVVYESILTKTRLDDKALRGDVLIKFKNYQINLEMYQKFNTNSFNKTVSYVMRIFSTQLDRGQNYDLLESVISINLIDNVKMDFNKKLENIYGIINTEDIKDQKLSDKFIIKFYNLDTARKLPYNEEERSTRWLKFIGAKSLEERKEVAEGDEILMALNETIYEYINDAKTKEIFQNWQDYIYEQQAREEERNSIVQAMLKNNVSPKEISKYTNLSISEIEKLKNDLN